jgi:2,5-diketo-D-gluconate reductase B
MHFVSANGANIPALGFGTYRIENADAARMIPHVISAGYRHIDTAQIYGNEAAIGDAVVASGIPRKDIFLTTKVWITNFHPDKFLASVDESLSKLRTDYLDLLLLHWPNDEVPLSDQIGALNEALTAGKTRHIGVSNYNTSLMAEATRLSTAPLVTNQVEYHPYLPQTALLSAARAEGLCLTAYYAMAEGKVLNDPLLNDIAAQHGKTIAQVVLRWLVQQRSVVALSKTISEERARQNFRVFDFTLTEVEMSAVHGLSDERIRLLNPNGLAPKWD